MPYEPSEPSPDGDRFRIVVDGAPNAIVMVDARGIIRLVNRQAEDLFGFRREELLGQVVEVLVPERFRGHHPALRASYHRDPTIRAMGAGRDLFGLRRDGREVPIEIGLNPVTTPDGTYFVASIIDITARKEAERRAQSYLEELRMVSRRLLEAQETERRAIARELHDEVGQRLTIVSLRLQNLKEQAGDGPLAGSLDEVSRLTAHLLEQVRRVSLNLRPSVLDDLGLAAAVRWCVRERVPRDGPVITLDLEDNLPRFSSVVETTLFRVFQEALSNALRHAEAARLSVHLARGQRVELTIRDDGRGFDPETARRRALAGTSLGIIGMQERVRLAGGDIAIESTPGEGTEVRVSVPVTET